jgi:hypothetical protein
MDTTENSEWNFRSQRLCASAGQFAAERLNFAEINAQRWRPETSTQSGGIFLTCTAESVSRVSGLGFAAPFRSHPSGCLWQAVSLRSAQELRAAEPLAQGRTSFAYCGARFHPRALTLRQVPDPFSSFCLNGVSPYWWNGSDARFRIATTHPAVSPPPAPRLTRTFALPAH